MKPPKPFIVKVQLPVSSNTANPKALVYNLDKTIMFEWDITPELMSWFIKGELKIYMLAQFIPDDPKLPNIGKVTLLERCKAKNW